MALRATVIEGKGVCEPARLAEYQHIMKSLWEEISELADFDKVIKINNLIYSKINHINTLSEVSFSLSRKIFKKVSYLSKV